MSLNGTWPIVAAYSIALRHSHGHIPMVSALGLISYRAKVGTESARVLGQCQPMASLHV